MKFVSISAKRIRTELMWLLYGFIFASVLNLYSIIKSGEALAGFIANLHKVLLLSLIFYVMMIFFRGLASLIIRFSVGRKKDIT